MEVMLTPQEISEILQLSYDTTLSFIKHSGVEYVKIGRQYRVSKTKLESFLAIQGSQNVKSKMTDIYHNNEPLIRKRKRRI